LRTSPKYVGQKRSTGERREHLPWKPPGVHPRLNEYADWRVRCGLREMAVVRQFQAFTTFAAGSRYTPRVSTISLAWRLISA
jgi:hypothetical protein